MNEENARVGPRPAVPEEGAVICRLRDVPVDGTWEIRFTDMVSWAPLVEPLSFAGRFVEARRPVPTVMVKLPLSVVEQGAAYNDNGDGWTAVVVAACRAALDAHKDGAS